MKHFHAWIGALILLIACKETPAPVMPMPEFVGFETEVTADAAVITVSHKGDYGIVEAGIYLGADKRIKADALDPGRFTVSVSGLEPSTEYTYKAFISSGLQEATSQEQTFTTAPAPKIVATGNGAYTVWTENTLIEDILREGGVDPKDIEHLKVVGSLAKEDFVYIRSQMRWLKSVDLRETDLTALPTRAFLLSGIESIELPDGLEEIGQSAFESCEQLSGTLRFPTSLKVIGTDAFSQCRKLEGIELPDGLERIGHYCFLYCDRLGGKLVLPESLLEIGERAFEGAAFHGDLAIPRNVKIIPTGAFMNAGFDGGLTLPEGLTEVGAVAFADSHFQGELKLPNSLDTIGDAAFSNVGFAGPLKLPAALKRLGESAFLGNSFSGDLVIPEGLREIPSYAFGDGAAIQQYERVILHKNVQWLKSGAFATSSETLKEVICYAEEPPVYEEEAFNAQMIPSITLFVPADAVKRYREADGWKGFGSIKSIE